MLSFTKLFLNNLIDINQLFFVWQLICSMKIRMHLFIFIYNYERSFIEIERSFIEIERFQNDCLNDFSDKIEGSGTG